jgi:hypothetical protein
MLSTQADVKDFSLYIFATTRKLNVTKNKLNMAVILRQKFVFNRKSLTQLTAEKAIFYISI